MIIVLMHLHQIERNGRHLHAVAVLLLVAAGLFSGARARSLTDSHFFTYGTVGWHSRDAYINFDDGRRQHFERALLRTQGVTIGRNLSLPLGLRIALPFIFEYGSVEEGVVEGVMLEDGTTPELLYNSVMYHAGCQPLFHFPLRLSDGVWAYGALGGGIHYVALVEEERISSDRKTRVIDEYLEKSNRVAASAAAGIGMEFAMTPRLVFSFSYLFQFWKPVSRETARDLFPLEKLPYAERFFTHSVSAGFLLAPLH